MNYIYKCVISLHKEVLGDFSAADLEAYFWATYPDATADVYAGLFKDLQSVQMSEDVGRATLDQIKRRKALLTLSEKAYAASQGFTTLEEVQAATQTACGEQVEDLQVPDEDLFITTDLEVLVENVIRTPGIRWPLQCLNKSIGSIRKGNFGFVFARPETGKTTFIAHCSAGALNQDRNVVWFNNEEEDQKVMLRVIQSYFGVRIDVLLANLKTYNEKFKAEVGSRFRLINSSRVSIDKSTVEHILRSTNPGLIIYDQIDKIKGFKADRNDLVYGEIYKWARDLAKTYAPTIGACQSDGSGEGQK